MAIEGMLFPNSKILQAGNPVGYWINKKMAGPPAKMQPQRLGELSSQTAKEGEPRPIVYGIGRPIGGNIMYMSQPIRKMVKTYVGKGGGKGGGKKEKQYQDVEHVYRYYAIRVCEGPITGYRRIWRNGALVYDGRKGSEWGAKNNHLFFKTYRLYTGSWDQMPDSVLQSQQEMDIPAYRGTAYLVADYEDLTDFGGAIPQWQFEVVRSEGYYLTSRPYALEVEESISDFDVDPLFAGENAHYQTEQMGGFSLSDITVGIRTLYNEVDVGSESMSSFSLSDLSVEMKQALKEYPLTDPESLSSFSLSEISVSSKEVLRQYTIDPAESMSGFSLSDLEVKIL